MHNIPLYFSATNKDNYKGKLFNHGFGVQPSTALKILRKQWEEHSVLVY